MTNGSATPELCGSCERGDHVWLDSDECECPFCHCTEVNHA